MIVDSILQSKSRQKIDTAHSEKWKRSLLKTLSWRTIGTIDTIVISYFLTGTLNVALSIGGIELITKMILYFFHERLWNQINWGK
ncbi:MAG: DUF2061 domain-containing protein [Crocinitomicaceae bacterium]|nr:DUF2061 domain-containing protein [Crocinitomicaceae bacterium]